MAQVLKAINDDKGVSYEAMLAQEATLQAQIEALRRENAKLKATTVKGLSLRVSVKGALSVYGLQRWPVTLYKEQWQTLLGITAGIEQFMAEHAGELKEKAED